jgi:hypothetical protein
VDSYGKYVTSYRLFGRSYGLTASSFNDIAKYVNDRPALRQKVILQAYYFRWDSPSPTRFE